MTTQAQQEYDARRELERKRMRVKRRSGYGTSARREKIDGHPCRMHHTMECSPNAWLVEYHHIVPRAHMRRDARIGDADNAMPLCHLHHQAHHTTADGRVPRTLLLPDEESFVLSVMGAGWLDRWYPETTLISVRTDDEIDHA